MGCGKTPEGGATQGECPGEDSEGPCASRGGEGAGAGARVRAREQEMRTFESARKVYVRPSVKTCLG